MKRVDDDVEEDEDHEHHSYNKQQQQISDTKKKSEWLRSAQLWNQNPDPLPKQVFTMSLGGRKKKREESIEGDKEGFGKSKTMDEIFFS